MILLDSRKFYNQFNNGINLDQNLSDFTFYLLGFIGQKMRRVTEINISWKSQSTTDNTFTTVSGQNTITRESGSWIDDEFIVGDTIFFDDIPDTPSADEQANTITNLTDLVMTCQDNFTFSIVANNAAVYGTTELLGLNYFSNFIENSDPVGYLSKVDSISTKKWSVEFTSGEYNAGTEKTAVAIGTNESWKIGSDEVKIKNTQVPASGNLYVQKFEITETFTITPFFDTITNLQNGIKPDYLIGAASLRHIAKVEAIPTILNPITIHILEDSEEPFTYGNVGYYDEQYNGFTPVEFTKDAIVYSNPSNESKIVVDETTEIVIKIDSLNNLFSANNTEFQLNIIFLNENIEKTDTIDTNYAFDTLFAVANGGSNSGVNGIFTNVTGTIISNQLVITADIDYTPTQQILIDEGKYIISVATNDHTLAIDQSKLVNVLCDLNSFIKNNDIPGLMGIDNHYFYEHPFDKGTQGKTDFKGWVEDGILVSADFWLDLSLDAVINTLNFKIAAYNSSTSSYFEIADIPFDFTTTVISNGIQEIDVDTIRGFKLIAGSQFNFVKIKKMAKVGDKQHYDLDIGIKLQWMDWISLPDADTVFYDNSKPQNGLNRLISNYSGKNGYEIVIFVDANVSDGNLNTNYRFISPAITIYEYDTDNTGDPSTKWAALTETFDQSSNNLQGNLIITENTDIKITFTALSGVISETVLYATVRLEEYQQGGLLNIWELSTFRDSALSNPLIPLSGQNKAIYTTFASSVEVECSIDFNKLNPLSTYKISGRLGTACNESSGCAWESQISGTSQSIFSIFFITPSIGWVSGAGGMIRKTTDGGVNWSPQVSGIANDLEDIFFIDSSTGWTCGGSGKLLKTADGGTTWLPQTSGTTIFTLWSIFFIDSSTGWTCATNGLIFKTTDGGTNWSPQTSGTPQPLFSIFFIDSSIGWVSGGNKTIIKTTDGGATWGTPLSLGTGFLETIFFIDSLIGWTGGTNGIFKTTDGGDTWGVQITGFSLRYIYFINSSTGWACGDGGVILKTTDGGTNWSPQTSGTIQTLYQIQMFTEINGFTAGNFGTILEFRCTPSCDILESGKLKEDGTQKLKEDGSIKIME